MSWHGRRQASERESFADLYELSTRGHESLMSEAEQSSSTTSSYLYAIDDETRLMVWTDTDRPPSFNYLPRFLKGPSLQALEGR